MGLLEHSRPAPPPASPAILGEPPPLLLLPRGRAKLRPTETTSAAQRRRPSGRAASPHVLPSCVLVRQCFTAPANLLSSRHATLSSSLLPLLGRRPAQPPCTPHSWSRRVVPSPPAAGPPPGRRAHHLSISSGCSASFLRPPPPGILPSAGLHLRRRLHPAGLPSAARGAVSLPVRRSASCRADPRLPRAPSYRIASPRHWHTLPGRAPSVSPPLRSAVRKLRHSCTAHPVTPLNLR
ncbi:uncharacterized protein LOC133901516 [Phragmites australis]|uniref:uncharacterized protein LOC133901516 n=1 Tax=Phragmites australis TaxID=29695 RepID=UPI002D781A62|nr:uncharacterized protein LOC133901516 [Phragmites australis]